MLCPQCGKSIENISTKVTLCENCLALKEEELNTTSSENLDGQEVPEENAAPTKENKPVNRKSKKSNVKVAVILTMIVIILITIILVSTLKSNQPKVKSSPKKVSALLESFSKENAEVVTPASPYPTPGSSELAPIQSPVEVASTFPEQEPTIAETNPDEINLDELDASIKKLERIESAKTTNVIVAPSEELSSTPSPKLEITPSASLTLTSPTPQVSPSPEKTIDESKLSEFDRRVLHTKRLKELENK